MKKKDRLIIEVIFDGNISYDHNDQFIRTHCTINNVTELNIKNEKIKVSEERLSLILSNIEEAVYEVDHEEKCTYVNQTLLNLLGYKKDEVLGKNMHQLIHHSRVDGTEYKSDECPMQKAFKQGEKVSVDVDYFWTKDGYILPIEYNINPSYIHRKPVGAIVTFKDISERIEHIKELEFQSYHDSLTGIYNRWYYTNKINEYNKKKQFPYAIINIDINGLKPLMMFMVIKLAMKF